MCSGCQVQKISSHEKKVRCCYFRSLATALINMSLHSQCLQKFLTPILNYFTYTSHISHITRRSSASSFLMTALFCSPLPWMDLLGPAGLTLPSASNRVGDFGGRLRIFCKRIDCHRLPGFPTFRRVKTRSSSQAKMNPDFAASSCGTCGTCGTVGGHTDWLRCAAFSPDSLKATALMWMNWVNMEQKGQVES